MNIVLNLFITFAKIGLFTFGGGYAMISLIENNCVEKQKWITHDKMMNVTVIAESTPGPIAINCATFVGYKQAGLIGSLAATFGIILPSFLIIYTLSVVLNIFLEIAAISYAFKGLFCKKHDLLFKYDQLYSFIKILRKDFLLPAAIDLMVILLNKTYDTVSRAFNTVSTISFPHPLGCHRTSP